MFDSSSSLVLLVVAIIACAIAAVFVNRYLSLKEKASKIQSGSSELDINIIEQATLSKSLQEQVEDLKAELDSIEHQYTVHKENATSEKLSLVKEISNLQTECQNLKEKLTEREEYIHTLQEQHNKALNETKSMHDNTIKELKEGYAAQTSTLKENIKKLEIDLVGKDVEIKKINERLQDSVVEQTELKSQNSTLELLRQEDQKRFEQAQNELEHRLNTMSEKILKERSESLQKVNNESMVQIINPLQNELNTFRNLIANTQKANSEQAGILQNELKHLHEAQQNLGLQAQNLSKALLQGSKSQGIWGEQQLELLLQASGLSSEQNYIKECFATNDQGDKGRADVLIVLPQNRGLVIDAKCSLTAYTELCNAQNDNDQKTYDQALSRHIDSIKKHIDELSKKKYPEFERYGSPNFVFMFVPIDHALALALRSNDKLYSYAQELNVYLVSPSSLLPALRIVGNLWALANQGNKYKEIVKRADLIYQKCSKICNDFEGLLKIRDSLNKNIDGMATSLCQGKGNLQKMLSDFAKDAPALSQNVLLEFKPNSDSNKILVNEIIVDPASTTLEAPDTSSASTASVSDDSASASSETQKPRAKTTRTRKTKAKKAEPATEPAPEQEAVPATEQALAVDPTQAPVLDPALVPSQEQELAPESQSQAQAPATATATEESKEPSATEATA